MISLEFKIDPCSKQRPRLGRSGVYTPTKTRTYESAIKTMAKMQYKGEVIDEPLAIEIDFFMLAPKKPRFEYPAVKPDIDNLSKAVLDAIEGVVFTNDSRVVDLKLKKRYGSPRVEMRIEKLSDYEGEDVWE